MDYHEELEFEAENWLRTADTINFTQCELLVMFADHWHIKKINEERSAIQKEITNSYERGFGAGLRENPNY